MARFRAFVTVLSLLLCSLAMAQDKCRTADSVARARAVEYYYLQARSYMDLDSLDCCFDMLEHCHSLDTSSLTVMYDLSSFYAFLKKDSVAHDMLVRIVDTEPSNIYYNNALVNYYLHVGNTDAAINVYEDLLGSVQAKSEIYMRLFSLYSETGRHDKAIDVLEKIERLEGSGEEIAINKVRLYMELEDSIKAVDTVLGLIKESPDDLSYLTLLGNTYLYFGDRSKALEAYNKVLAIKPDDVYALTSLSDLYINADDTLYCAVVERLLKSEGLDPQTRAQALVQYIEYAYPKDSTHMTDFMRDMARLPFDELEIANVYSHYLKFIKAPADTIVPVLEKILSLEPDNLGVIVRLLEYAIERNDLNAVFKYADNAQPYCPDKIEVYYYKGLSSYLLGRKKESIDIYNEGLAKRADDTSPELVSAVYALLGDTYNELGMMDCCMQAYDSALVYDNTNIALLNNYAYFLAVADIELNRALEMIQKVISIEPDNVTYIDTYAWVLFKLRRYEEAKAYAEMLVSVDDELAPDVYHHCGDIYAKCGDMGQAVNYWQMAKKYGDDSKILDKKIRKRKYYNDAKRKK